MTTGWTTTSTSGRSTSSPPRSRRPSAARTTADGSSSASSPGWQRGAPRVGGPSPSGPRCTLRGRSRLPFSSWWRGPSSRGAPRRGRPRRRSRPRPAAASCWSPSAIIWSGRAWSCSSSSIPRLRRHPAPASARGPRSSWRPIACTASRRHARASPASPTCSTSSSACCSRSPTAPPRRHPRAREALRRRIEAEGVLFKIEIVGAGAGERADRPAVRPASLRS